MKIAIEGCAHGELEKIYETIKLIEETDGIKIDILICCGDFQSCRNEADLLSMAVPSKYMKMCTFYKYYNGEKKAPILTIFIGGNHEASNYLQELPYGGWVAPNIYYLGYAGVINVAGVRIAGLSGIYKGKDYLKGHFEKAPYNESSKRSVYHIRNLEVFRLKQLSQPLDIFISHDWPSGIVKFGNINQLLKKKPFLKEEIENNQLGSKPCEALLHQLKPEYWFAAHMHCKFAALVPHEDKTATRFLALDKCLPKRKFLQVVTTRHEVAKDSKIKISYDLEWLTVLYLTNHLLSVKNMNTFMPGPGSSERYNFTPTEEEKQHILNRFNNDLCIPNNFEKVGTYFESSSPQKKKVNPPEAKLNPQTVIICETLCIDDPICLVSEMSGTRLSLSIEQSSDANGSFIDDTIDQETSTLSETSFSSKKLISLSLPEPKVDAGDEFESDTKENTEEELETCSQSSGDNIMIPTLKDNESGVKNCESPLPKKFKKRNAEMYSSENKMV